MTAQRQPLSKHLRVAISLLLVAHLMGVLLPPLSFQARGPLGLSPSIATAFAPLEGYSQFLYIDRGYAFFAPDPGPSHLVRAAIRDGDQVVAEVTFPDLEQQRPRLLYHRHFMLTEYLDEIYQPPGPPQELVELDRGAAEAWVRSRARYEFVRQSVTEHLQYEYPGKQVAIQRLEHLIPDVIAFQNEPVALDDPRFYQVIRDLPVEFDTDDSLTAPARAPETIPPPPEAEFDAEDLQSADDDRQPSAPENDDADDQPENPSRDESESESSDSADGQDQEPSSQDETATEEAAADEPQGATVETATIGAGEGDS